MAVPTRRLDHRPDIAADLPAVLGDRVQLQQVLLNLVVNGMDAMSALEASERTLEISARVERRDGGPVATISVRDRGVGLESGHADRLFQAFFTTKAHGMGLGLAISRTIIESHGGRLWAESNHGPGATFSFSPRPPRPRRGDADRAPHPGSCTSRGRTASSNVFKIVEP